MCMYFCSCCREEASYMYSRHQKIWTWQPVQHQGRVAQHSQHACKRHTGSRRTGRLCYACKPRLLRPRDPVHFLWWRLYLSRYCVVTALFKKCRCIARVLKDSDCDIIVVKVARFLNKLCKALVSHRIFATLSFQTAWMLLAEISLHCPLSSVKFVLDAWMQVDVESEWRAIPWTEKGAVRLLFM